MLTAAKWVMGITAGGMVLGALLGEAVDPRMKAPPEPWWRLTGQEANAEPQTYGFAEATQYASPGGFRPNLDYDAEVWALPLPDYDIGAFAHYEFSDLADYEFSDFADYEGEDEPSLEGLDEPAFGDLGAPTDETLAAVEEAVEPAPGEPLKSDLAMAGLY